LFGKATNLRELITAVSREIDAIDLAARAAQTQAQRDVAKKTAAFEAERLKTLADINKLKSVEAPQANEASPQQEGTGVVLAYNSEGGETPGLLPNVDREVVDYNTLLDSDLATNPKDSFVKTRRQMV